jgi:hypothetical protein
MAETQRPNVLEQFGKNHLDDLNKSLPIAH